jgi:hypothetical protein
MKVVKPNQVLIKTDRSVNQMYHKLDSGLILTSQWEPHRDAVITGEVIEASRIEYSRKGVKRAGGGGAQIEYGSAMELKKGDKIYYRYTAAKSAYEAGLRFVEKDGKFRLFELDDMEVQNNDCVLINYDEIFCKVVDDVPIPVNGWVIMEQCLDEISQKNIEKWGLDIPEKYKPTFHPYHCRVIATPERPISEYFWDRPYGPTHNFVKSGDIAIVQISFDLENEVVKTNKHWQLVRVEERSIIGKYDENGNVILNKRKVALRLKKYDVSDYIEVVEREKPYYTAEVAIMNAFDRYFIDSFEISKESFGDPVAVLKKGTIGMKVNINGEELFVVDIEYVLFFMSAKNKISLSKHQREKLAHYEQKRLALNPKRPEEGNQGNQRKIILEP